MSAGNEHRRALIIKDEDASSIGNILYVLLAGLGWEAAVAFSARQGLAMISQEGFDVVFLLRCPKILPEQVVPSILGIRPILARRVVVMNGEMSGAQEMNFVHHNCLPHVRNEGPTHELSSALQAVVGSCSSPCLASDQYYSRSISPCADVPPTRDR